MRVKKSIKIFNVFNMLYSSEKTKCVSELDTVELENALKIFTNYEIEDYLSTFEPNKDILNIIQGEMNNRK